MIKLGLALGGAALLLALVPLPPVSQLLAALLGVAAAVTGFLGRQAARRSGAGTSLSHATLALGILAVLTSGVIFASCAACEGRESQADISVEFQKKARTFLK